METNIVGYQPLVTEVDSQARVKYVRVENDIYWIVLTPLNYLDEISLAFATILREEGLWDDIEKVQCLHLFLERPPLRGFARVEEYPTFGKLSFFVDTERAFVGLADAVPVEYPREILQAFQEEIVR